MCSNKDPVQPKINSFKKPKKKKIYERTADGQDSFSLLGHL